MSDWHSTTEQIGIEQFQPKHIASVSTAFRHLFTQFKSAMGRVYRIWHDHEPEWSDQEVSEVINRWKENFAIAKEKWGETEEFTAGLSTLIHQMQFWKSKGKNEGVKAGAMTKQQMALVRYVKSQLPEAGAESVSTLANRLEWCGSTISYIEIFEGLIRKGYLQVPEENLTEFYRRLNRAIVVLKGDQQSELSLESLLSRARGKRNDILMQRMNALPDARNRQQKK